MPRLLGRRLAGALACLAIGLAGALGLSSAGTLVDASSAQAASSVSVYPLPGTKYNLPATQISFRAVAPDQIGTVQVVGSKSGSHTGQIKPDSDNAGGSFIPAQPFQAGETVTVTTSLHLVGAPKGTFSFTIARTAGPIQPGPIPQVSAGPHGLQRFRTRPDLLPAAVDLLKDSAPASEGDLFVAPQYGPDQDGPMILDPHGRLIWFLPFPISRQVLVTDFRVQTFNHQPVLTWWQGSTNRGSGRGVGVIYNSNYRQIATVRAGNGLAMDLHEFLLTPQGTAWVIAASPVFISGIDKPVMDAVIQEIDISTGLVLFEWHALDHVPLADSYFPPKHPGTAYVYDPYHMNSVSPTPEGNLLVSMRNTSTVYEVQPSTGKILWQLGGPQSSFKLGKGVSTAFQHDAVAHADGSITIFDDGAGPPPLHAYSRGIRLRLDTQNMTAALVREYDHSPNISSDFEGSVQELGDGNVFMGWGQQPYFSEDNASGQQIFDARFAVPSSTYRAYRFAWSGHPTTTPVLAVAPNPDGHTELYASWNGATDVARWRILTGTSATSLTPIGTAPWGGFETAIEGETGLGYVAIQALDATRHVLSTSAAEPAPPHLGVVGGSVFVSAGGTGEVPAQCLSTSACSVSTTISTGGKAIARTGAEALGAGRGGPLFFNLSRAGRSVLAHARGNRLAVSISLHAGGGLSATRTVNLIEFGTRGAGPSRTVTQAATLQLAGLTAFVSPGGTGGLLAACYAPTPCHPSARLTVGGTTIASTPAEFLGPDQLGYVVFSLTAAGRSMLAHASGNQLGAAVRLTGGGETTRGSVALVAFR